MWSVDMFITELKRSIKHKLILKEDDCYKKLFGLTGTILKSN